MSEVYSVYNNSTDVLIVAKNAYRMILVIFVLFILIS